MGAYGAASVLLLAGWSMLQSEAAWAYIAAFVAFEAWLARRDGRHVATRSRTSCATGEGI